MCEPVVKSLVASVLSGAPAVPPWWKAVDNGLLVESWSTLDTGFVLKSTTMVVDAGPRCFEHVMSAAFSRFTAGGLASGMAAVRNCLETSGFLVAEPLLRFAGAAPLPLVSGFCDRSDSALGATTGLPRSLPPVEGLWCEATVVVGLCKRLWDREEADTGVHADDGSLRGLAVLGPVATGGWCVGPT